MKRRLRLFPLHLHENVIYNSGKEKEDEVKSIRKRRIRPGEGLCSRVSLDL